MSFCEFEEQRAGSPFKNGVLVLETNQPHPVLREDERNTLVTEQPFLTDYHPPTFTFDNGKTQLVLEPQPRTLIDSICKANLNREFVLRGIDALNGALLRHRTPVGFYFEQTTRLFEEFYYQTHVENCRESSHAGNS